MVAKERGNSITQHSWKPKVILTFPTRSGFTEECLEFVGLNLELVVCY
jgi:hypothetical protein